MASIVFFTHPMSRGQIARWMLEEVGVAYEERLLDWGAGGSASDEFRKVNPMMKVPAIVHDGQVVTEAAAIGLYLADSFPDCELAPRPDERANYFRWTLFAAGPLEQAATAKALGWEVPDDSRQRAFVGFGSYDRTVDALEQHLNGHHFICGDRFTMADCYVGSHLDWGIAFGTLPERPAFAGYLSRLRGRDAYRRAKARDNALIERGLPQAQE